FSRCGVVRAPRSPPTRRSSDLHRAAETLADVAEVFGELSHALVQVAPQLADLLRVAGDALLLPAVGDRAQQRDQGGRARDDDLADRKSTRLNSSHVKISYAVFC